MFKRKKPTKEQRQESEEWNNWKPGSGRKGWSPFTKPVPRTKVIDTETGHEVGMDYWKEVIRRSNEENE